MTDERPIPQRMPIVEKMAPGKYLYCACGESAKQPFCDGSHGGTGYGPKLVNIEEEKMVAWCACKRSANEPFCDGAHSRLP